MGRRLRSVTREKVTRQKRVVSFVTVQREVMTCGPIYVAFAQAVRDARTKIGMTQDDLAKAVGLSRTSVTNIEIGRQRVLLGDVFDFAAALGLKPEKLFAMVATTQKG